MPRDLKLNSLSRYSKLSPYVALEEHGHCEIPAGCGGVVLRWRDRGCGARIPLHLYGCGRTRILLDGTELHSGLVFFPLGEHVLSVEVEEARPGRLVFMAAAVDTNHQYPDVGPPLLTAADGTWKYAVSPPPEPAWWYPEFDDSDWAPMVRNEQIEREPSRVNAGDYWAQQVEELRGFGAVGLGIPAGAGKVWIRKRFTLERRRGGPEGAP